MLLLLLEYFLQVKSIGNVVEGAVDIGTNAARKIDLSKVNSAMARANEVAEDQKVRYNKVL